MIQYLESIGKEEYVVGYGVNTYIFTHSKIDVFETVVKLLEARMHTSDWFATITDIVGEHVKIGIYRRGTGGNKKIYIHDTIGDVVVIFPVVDPYDLSRASISCYKINSVNEIFRAINSKSLYELNRNIINDIKLSPTEANSIVKVMRIPSYKKYLVKNCKESYKLMLWKYLCYAIFAIKELVIYDLRRDMYHMLIGHNKDLKI
jgi:hypothetical protein